MKADDLGLSLMFPGDSDALWPPPPREAELKRPPSAAEVNAAAAWLRREGVKPRDVELFKKEAAARKIAPGYLAAACFPRVACSPHLILKEWHDNTGTHRAPEVWTGGRRKKWFSTKDTLLFLVAHGVEVLFGAGVALTLFKLAMLPPENNYIGRRKLASIGARSRGVIGEHLVRLRRPWWWRDAWYPPLYFAEKRWTPKAKRYLTHYRSNRYGWEHLFAVLATACGGRKESAHAAEEAVKEQQRASAAQARAALQRPENAGEMADPVLDPLALDEG